MQLKVITPTEIFDKAQHTERIYEGQFKGFKQNLSELLGKFNNIGKVAEKKLEIRKKHENYLTKALDEFLSKTFYNGTNEIGPIDNKDLVIHLGKTSDTEVGVIIEAKLPSNSSEMISVENPHAKALYELIFYYFDERIRCTNGVLKHLIITDGNKWYIFDAIDFNKIIYENRQIYHLYEACRNEALGTNHFYNSVAKLLSGNDFELNCTYFDISNYKNLLENDEEQRTKELLALYHILSPAYLLKFKVPNDNNSLNKNFYNELLHILGLIETKDGSKKLIGRKKENRNSGSFIENTIEQLEALNKNSFIGKEKQFGKDLENWKFNVALELSITWLNRILFLKLLEAQLIKYQKDEKLKKEYSFLNLDTIKSFGDLDTLFFFVLAKVSDDRIERIYGKFNNIPYLNSSLFEPTQLEQNCFTISQLNNLKIPLYSGTVLDDEKRLGELPILEYMLKFLDAYNFASEGTEFVQTENNRLINASVLGLIFEKINGYKDGSFFTPSFITMYMCRETLRRAVVQKFNEEKKWDCADINTLRDKLNFEISSSSNTRKDIEYANAIINSLKICDPAVGSGHFLVSALNEILAIKSKLNVLRYRDGSPFIYCKAEVINDELVIKNGALFFEYDPNDDASQKIQEAIFHEKQTIIENCLFGVDINPNSVNICRLRLWIELLKNAYYKTDLTPTLSKGEGERQLETLPNIDINIKCGNSLISRYALDLDFSTESKNSKKVIEAYKQAVMCYKNAQSKEDKRTAEKQIAFIKCGFKKEADENDKELNNLKSELITLTNQTTLFERTKDEQAKWEKQITDIKNTIEKREIELEDIKTNSIYENAFEWRFEFPEVLNDDGEFIGFDVIIGNPPYVDNRGYDKGILHYYYNRFINSFAKSGTNKYKTTKLNLIAPFFEIAVSIVRPNGSIQYIFHKNILKTNAYSCIRKFILEECKIISIVDWGAGQFEEVIAETSTIVLKKSIESNENVNITFFNKNTFLKKISQNQNEFKTNYDYIFSLDISMNDRSIIKKIEILENTLKLSDLVIINNGIVTGNDKKYLCNKLLNFDYKPAVRGREVKRYCTFNPKTFVLFDKHELLRARDEKIFRAKEKLIMQMINTEFIVTYDNKQVYNLGTTYAITNISDISLKYILALLNSKLYNYYYKKKFINDSSLTNAISTKNLYEFTIPEINKVKQLEFEQIVNQILSLKQADPKADTSALEKEIDKLVYELYGLTEEEIMVVEGV